MDHSTTVSQLKEIVHTFVEKRDWYKFHTPRNLAVSISIESSELLECFQWVPDNEAESVLRNPKKLRDVESELADITIYCLSLANVLGTSLSEIVQRKIEENEKKYPVEAKKNALQAPAALDS